MDTGQIFLRRSLRRKPSLSFYQRCGMTKPEPYTKEPYSITESELREREEREARAKEESLKSEFAAFVERMRSNFPKT